MVRVAAAAHVQVAFIRVAPGRPSETSGRRARRARAPGHCRAWTRGFPGTAAGPGAVRARGGDQASDHLPPSPLPFASNTLPSGSGSSLDNKQTDNN